MSCPCIYSNCNQVQLKVLDQTGVVSWDSPPIVRICPPGIGIPFSSPSNGQATTNIRSARLNLTLNFMSTLNGTEYAARYVISTFDATSASAVEYYTKVNWTSPPQLSWTRDETGLTVTLTGGTT